MTQAQQADLETVRYFIPKDLIRYPEPAEQDVQDFFEWSERGLHKDRIGQVDGFNALVQGKRWRGIHMEMWEQGVLDGTVALCELVEAPFAVVEFMAKEMFKGQMAQTIRNARQACKDYVQ